jgi:hypothetical protein
VTVRSCAALAGTLGAGLTMLAGCSADPAASGTPAPELSFREVRLPAPATGRAVVGDLAVCQGRWYAAGAVATGAATAPGAWSSSDGEHWTAIPLTAVSAYGPKQTLTTAACRGRRLLAVGGAAGGAHGNLRTSSWAGDADGLAENPAGMELFGGPDHLGVDRAAAGPSGWLLGGARSPAGAGAGAAVWFSADARGFTLLDRDPQLRSDARGRTVLADVAPDPAGGFAAVGSLSSAAGSAVRAPLAWTSPDGRRWARQPVPAVPQDAELQAITADGPDLVAAGVLGRGFGVWRRPAGAAGWRPAHRFGAIAGSGLPYVTGLVRGGGALYATVRDGSRYRLWRGAEGGTGDWRELALPVAVAGTGATAVRLAAIGDRMLLATEDGTVSRLWLAGPG